MCTDLTRDKGQTLHCSPFRSKQEYIAHAVLYQAPPSLQQYFHPVTSNGGRALTSKNQRCGYGAPKLCMRLTFLYTVPQLLVHGFRSWLPEHIGRAPRRSWMRNAWPRRQSCSSRVKHQAQCGSADMKGNRNLRCLIIRLEYYPPYFIQARVIVSNVPGISVLAQPPNMGLSRCSQNLVLNWRDTCATPLIRLS